MPTPLPTQPAPHRRSLRPPARSSVHCNRSKYSGINTPVRRLTGVARRARREAVRSHSTAQLDRLNRPTPAAGDRHDETSMAAIDR